MRLIRVGILHVDHMKNVFDFEIDMKMFYLNLI